MYLGRILSVSLLIGVTIFSMSSCNLFGSSTSTITSTTVLVSNPTDLELGAAFTDGEIIAGGQAWFRIPVNAGSEYLVQWQDSVQKDDSNSYPTADIKVTIYRNDKSNFYVSNVNSGYLLPESFTASQDGYAFIQVQGYLETSFGTFQIRAYTYDAP